MSKEEFSDREQKSRTTRRDGQDRGSFGGKDAEKRDGEQLRKDGAHSNTGVGDEQVPIRENDKE